MWIVENTGITVVTVILSNFSSIKFPSSYSKIFRYLSRSTIPMKDFTYYELHKIKKTRINLNRKITFRFILHTQIHIQAFIQFQIHIFYRGTYIFFIGWYRRHNLFISPLPSRQKVIKYSFQLFTVHSGVDFSKVSNVKSLGKSEMGRCYRNLCVKYLMVFKVFPEPNPFRRNLDPFFSA